MPTKKKQLQESFGLSKHQLEALTKLKQEFNERLDSILGLKAEDTKRKADSDDLPDEYIFGDGVSVENYEEMSNDQRLELTAALKAMTEAGIVRVKYGRDNAVLMDTLADILDASGNYVQFGNAGLGEAIFVNQDDFMTPDHGERETSGEHPNLYFWTP